MKAIVLAAGFGTRMLPITKTIPKEMLPVGYKPVIQYTIEWLALAGIEDILMVTSQWKKALEDYFGRNYELEDKLMKKGKTEILDLINKPRNLANYMFIKQQEMLWTGHAVLETKPWMNSDYFIVVYGDAIYPPNMFVEMVKVFEQTKSPVMCVHEVPMSETYKYGVIKLDWDKIIDIVEKPRVEDAPSNLVFNGACLLPKSIFGILDNTKPDGKSGEVYLTDAIVELMNSQAVLPLRVAPFWDVGNPEALLKANVHLAQSGSLF